MQVNASFGRHFFIFLHPRKAIRTSPCWNVNLSVTALAFLSSRACEATSPSCQREERSDLAFWGMASREKRDCHASQHLVKAPPGCRELAKQSRLFYDKKQKKERLPRFTASCQSTLWVSRGTKQSRLYWGCKQKKERLPRFTASCHCEPAKRSRLWAMVNRKKRD